MNCDEPRKNSTSRWTGCAYLASDHAPCRNVVPPGSKPVLHELPTEVLCVSNVVCSEHALDDEVAILLEKGDGLLGVDLRSARIRKPDRMKTRSEASVQYN